MEVPYKLDWYDDIAADTSKEKYNCFELFLPLTMINRRLCTFLCDCKQLLTQTAMIDTIHEKANARHCYAILYKRVNRVIPKNGDAAGIFGNHGT